MQLKSYRLIIQSKKKRIIKIFCWLLVTIVTNLLIHIEDYLYDIIKRYCNVVGGTTSSI